jgi:hypothetical protein
MIRIQLVLAFLLGSVFCSAQSSRQVITRHIVWGGVYAEYKFTPALSATLDIQGRYEYTDGDWVQWLVRAGAWYKLNHGIILGAGLARFDLYPNPNGKPPRPEWRPWEEIGEKINVGAHQTIYPRFRFEQRFIKDYDGNELAAKTTFNSFRERIRIDYSYRFSPEKNHSLSFVESQEILFATKTSGFSAMDAFRFSAGFAYAFNKSISTQLVYLYQLQQKDSKHFEEQEIIRFTLQFSLAKPLKKSE